MEQQKAEAQLIEQKITQQITITAGTSDTVTISIPNNTKVFLKGYGYTWFTSNTFQLTVGNLTFPSRSDQEGSTSIPVIFGNPFSVTTGNISLRITNGDSADHTYDVVFYVLTNRILDVNSTGGELILTTGSSGGIPNAVTIYDSSVSTAANVTAKGLDVYPQVPTTLLAGSQTTAGASALALASSTTCKRVTVQADTSNGSEVVLIGNATSQLVQLYAGQAIDLEIDDLAKIYIKRCGGTNVTVNYIGA